MDATPILEKVAKAMSKIKLEAIMIGNAAAALHGAPITTLDFDFMFRESKPNLNKLDLLAKELNATISQPYMPLSDMFRIENQELQLDFLQMIDGIKSFASLRSRATYVEFDKQKISIASLEDIIKSKKAAHRDKDMAVINILEKTLTEVKNERS